MFRCRNVPVDTKDVSRISLKEGFRDGSLVLDGMKGSVFQEHLLNSF